LLGGPKGEAAGRVQKKVRPARRAYHPCKETAEATQSEHFTVKRDNTTIPTLPGKRQANIQAAHTTKS